MIDSIIEFKYFPPRDTNQTLKYRVLERDNKSDYLNIENKDLDIIISELFKKKIPDNFDELKTLLPNIKTEGKGKLLILLHDARLNKFIEKIKHRLESSKVEDIIFYASTSDEVNKYKFKNLLCVLNTCGYTEIYNEFVESKNINNGNGFSEEINFEESRNCQTAIDYISFKADLTRNHEEGLINKFNDPNKEDDKHPIIYTIDKNLDLDSFRPELDPRYLFFDSSIWFRLDPGKLTLQGNPLKTLNQEKLIKQIERDAKWYNYQSAKEYREFQIRLYNESYITTRSGYHNSEITPFKFHSESLASEKVSRIARKILSTCPNGSKYKFNVLLIDDHASSDLYDCPETSKFDRIKEVLSDMGSTIKWDGKREVHLVPIFEESDKKIEISVVLNENYPSQNTKLVDDLIWADIVLLDYIFRPENETDPYMKSHHFLYNIFSGEYVQTINFPIYVLPISAYNGAFLDMIKMKGVPYNSKNLILMDGADPICEPELFRLQLFRLIYSRITEHILNDGNNFKSNMDELCNSVNRDELRKRIKKSQLEIFNSLQKFKILLKRPTAFSECVISHLYIRHNSELPLSVEDCNQFYEVLYLLGYDPDAHEDRIINIISNTATGELRNLLIKLKEIVWKK